MNFKLTQTNHSKSWSRLAINESQFSESELNEVRQRRFKRLCISVFVWVSAIFLLYCSLFYVGAYVDAGKVVGLSQAKRIAKVKNKIMQGQDLQQRHLLSPIADAFSMNKVYLREGQIIQATYSVPSGTKIHLKVKQCKSQPILEIFKCKFIGEQEKLIQKGSAGIVTFIISESGFYYFDDKATQLSGTDLKPNYDYKVIWQRA